MQRSFSVPATVLGISRNLLTRLSKHYQTEGLAQPSKKSGGRRSNTRSLKYQDTEAVKKFICHYAEDHAVSLPGRVPGFKREDIRLLPSAIPKSGIYRQYADHANQAGLRVVGASTFRQLWLELCPYIVVAKPMTDLCWRCQRNNGRIFRGTFITDEEKNELILEQQRHLSQVNGERQLYQQMTAEAKEAVCCSDHIHCCPYNMKCNLSSGACDGNSSQSLSRKIPAVPRQKVTSVICPDDSTCPDKTTCCKDVAGGYACCPYKQAVCCSDKIHCCPNGFTCNVAAKTCTMRDISIPWMEKKSSMPREKGLSVM
ncbi:hypothetical protein ACOMHN_054297 [Nucella lapillus]